MSDGICVPVQMTNPRDCKIECTTRCACITYGLKCAAICTGCWGVSCQNFVLSDLDVEV